MSTPACPRCDARQTVETLAPEVQRGVLLLRFWCADCRVIFAVDEAGQLREVEAGR